MVGELITLPVRVGVRVTRLWFRALEETVSVTSTATGRVIELLASRSPNGHAAQAPADPITPTDRPAPADRPRTARRRPSADRPAPADRPTASDRPVPAPAPPAPQPPPTPAAQPTAEPAHVSEEPEVVDEFAEPGAEDGAGAEVHVDPPWDGYEQMSVKQVIARFAGADPAQLAAVQLFESSHRRRQTILNAVERELRTANGSRSRPNKQ